MIKVVHSLTLRNQNSLINLIGLTLVVNDLSLNEILEPCSHICGLFRNILDDDSIV